MTESLFIWSAAFHGTAITVLHHTARLLACQTYHHFGDSLSVSMGNNR